MSETSLPHEPSVEARWLRANWDASHLGQFEGHWIAVKGEGVRAYDTSIADLIKRAQGFDPLFDPLYAYVQLGPRQ